ncbi:MAG TPA: glycerol-3-phosphate dehydrogenase [Pseudomonas sp.]|uniref:glycerol-3-phosphate dehydrogenase n=1 Tax=Pseudomonas sp. TaxID=306 RepID=UPI002B9AA77F|nr:glycerol-3-phosphate dehydrogenase [Pseudomonas sp.]HTO18247.1 glycerol-3-phosphate dehydrogenase [Pseudomonas sp.]
MNEPCEVLYDLAVIGGGINGAGIAADAAGRGLQVYLCEQHDLANHTSSASSKLIHGGLRYLEHREFRLVHEALAEREVLLGKAPHIIKPLRFILPHRPHLRPAWMIRFGLFCYDHLGRRRTLPGSRGLRLGADSPLRPDMTRGFEYSDCWVDDARLVVLNAMAAREHGARVDTRTRCLSAQARDGVWQLDMERADGRRFHLHARALVNACGPWVADFLRDGLQCQPRHGVRLVQGSHIVVPRLYPGEQAYILQNEDRRIVFVIPWLERFSLIGTTDREYHGDPAQVRISEEEIEYLLAVVNQHFRQPVERDDILHSFSGVRPLLDDESGDPSAVTRDYFLELHGAADQAPLLSVFGGKLTTYRRLAESALELLKPWLKNMGPRWTADAPLPGGEEMDDQLAAQLVEQAPWLPVELARRWAVSYGSRSWRLLASATGLGDLGEHFGAGLYAREVDYLRREEWAQSAEDILWRRGKLGLFLEAEQCAGLDAYLQREPMKMR